MSYSRVKRVNNEIEELKNNPSEFWTFERSLINENLLHFVFKYSPDMGTIEYIRVDIKMTEKYPFHEPHITFIDKFNHPCMDPESGVFNLYFSGADWSPALTLTHTAMGLYSVIYQQDPSIATTVERTNKFKAELLSKTFIPIDSPEF
jgi:ubiquitin-protein ligase